jgi:hypothetical protein
MSKLTLALGHGHFKEKSRRFSFFFNAINPKECREGDFFVLCHAFTLVKLISPTLLND